jgi:hypothetical protein
VVTDFESKVSVSSDVLIRHVGGESVVLDLKTEQYLGLNEVGTRMWQVLAGAESIEAAYQSLLAEFDVERDQLRRDLDEFVQELLHLGVVQLGHQP